MHSYNLNQKIATMITLSMPLWKIHKFPHKKMILSELSAKQFAFCKESQDLP